MRNEVIQKQQENRRITISRSEKFSEHLKLASEIVSKWPKWKREVLKVG